MASEVIRSIDCDPIYGPRHDRERRIIGVEYEIMLEQILLEKGIPFETESQLRIKGTARTPDILLSCPIGVKIAVHSRNRNQSKNAHLAGKEYQWKVVCWIDSKALFGDDQTHNFDVLPQAEAFVHRFGPGLILYWYGHAPIERLSDGHGDVIVSAYRLPECIILPGGGLRTA